ncbi:MAG TPA: AMP-binding protein, partial [Mycobacteriales bacterium]|nr:AMP-binding protein [Mycobacteriales bacterium]
MTETVTLRALPETGGSPAATVLAAAAAYLARYGADRALVAGPALAALMGAAATGPRAVDATGAATVAELVRAVRAGEPAPADPGPDSVAVVLAGEPALPAGTVLRVDPSGAVELDRAANRLAHALVAAGAGPDRLVALDGRRTPAGITGMLAAWRAGAAYLPLDPGYPRARLGYLLADAAPAVLLAAGWDGELPAGTVLLDPATAGAGEPAEPPPGA